MTTSKDNAVLVDDDQLDATSEVGTRPSVKLKRQLVIKGHVIEGFNLVLLSVVVFSVATTIALIITLILGVHEVQLHGSAYTDHHYCSLRAADLMKNGKGNAIDAAIFSFFCQMVTRPDTTSAFGCGSMIIHDRDNQTSHLFDFSCYTPSETSSSSDYGVSGIVTSLKEIHSRFGALKWSKLFEELIIIAKDGFDISNDLQISIEKEALKGGIQTKNEELSSFLSAIANDEKFIFNTNIMNSLVELTNSSSIVNDTLSYKSSEPKPYTYNHFGYVFEAFPTPWLGGIHNNLVMTVLDQYFSFNSINRKFTKNDTGILYHRLLESYKIAQIAMTKLTNQENNANINEEVFMNFTFTKFLDKIRDSQVLPDKTYGQIDFDNDPMNQWSNIGDSMIMTTDPYRFTVSAHSYMGKPFGSKQKVKGTGQFLNSALSLFLNDINGTETSIERGPMSKPLIPSGSIYYRTKDRKCGVRGTIGSIGGIFGLADLSQSLINTMFILQGKECGSTLDPTSESIFKNGMSLAYLKECWPLNQGVKAPRTNTLVQNNEKAMNNTDYSSPIFIENQIDDNVLATLEKLYSDNYSIISKKEWKGSVSSLAWNGYKIEHSADSSEDFRSKLVNF